MARRLSDSGALGGSSVGSRGRGRQRSAQPGAEQGQDLELLEGQVGTLGGTHADAQGLERVAHGRGHRGGDPAGDDLEAVGVPRLAPRHVDAVAGEGGEVGAQQVLLVVLAHLVGDRVADEVGDVAQARAVARPSPSRAGSARRSSRSMLPMWQSPWMRVWVPSKSTSLNSSSRAR